MRPVAARHAPCGGPTCASWWAATARRTRSGRRRLPSVCVVEILLWLVPAVLVTAVAAAVAAYAGREPAGVPDREETLARIGEALDRDLPQPRRTRGEEPPRRAS